MKNDSKETTCAHEVRKKDKIAPSTVMELLNEGLYEKQIARKLGISRFAVYRIIKKLEKAGLVEEKMRTAYKAIGITDAGKTAINRQKVRNRSVGLRGTFLGLHNIGFRFNILRGFQPSNLKTRSMRNWSASQYNCRTHYVEITTKSVIIMPILRGQRWYGKDPFELQQRARDKAVEIAQKIAQKYNLELGPPELSRKPHFAINNAVTRLFKGMELNTPKYKIDESEGKGGEIDFYAPDDAKAFIDTMMDMPNQIKALTSTFTEKVIPPIEKLAQQIELHLEATRTWKDSAVALNQTVGGLADTLKALNRPADAQIGVSPAILDLGEPEPDIRLEILEDIPAFLCLWRGTYKQVGPFPQGARDVYLPEETAKLLIVQDKARKL